MSNLGGCMKKAVFVCLSLVLIFLVDTAFGVSGFQNAGFEDGDLAFWNASGNVSISSGDIYTSPHEGSYMALLSSPGYSDGEYIYDNHMGQDIDAQASTISFWYNFFTMDYDYDVPGFAVAINGNDVFSINAIDVGIEYSDPIWMTDWQQFSYDISSYEGTVSLAIYAGNSDDMGGNGDNSYNSWAYIDFAEPIFHPIPEPCTGLILVVGFFFLFFLKRKIII